MAMGRFADNVASLIQRAQNSNAAFPPLKTLGTNGGKCSQFPNGAGKKEKVSSANCFSKIVKEVIIFSLSFPHRTNMLELIDCDDDDVEKDTGIDFEIDSGPPKN